MQGPTPAAGPCAPGGPARSACCSPSSSPTRSPTPPPSPPCAASPRRRSASASRSACCRRRSPTTPPTPRPSAARSSTAASSTRCPRITRASTPRSSATCPLVVADTPHIPGVPFVSIDDRAGARAAAQHLLDLGHRRLAVVSLRMRDDGGRGFADSDRRCDPAYRVTAERLAGYEEALAGAGLSLDDVPIYEVHLNARTLAREAVPALLERGPTAVLGMSDEIALGVIDGARRRRARPSSRPLRRGLRRHPRRHAAPAHHGSAAARGEGPHRRAHAARGDRGPPAGGRRAADRAGRPRIGDQPSTCLKGSDPFRP